MAAAAAAAAGGEKAAWATIDPAILELLENLRSPALSSDERAAAHDALLLKFAALSCRVEEAEKNAAIAVAARIAAEGEAAEERKARVAEVTRSVTGAAGMPLLSEGSGSAAAVPDGTGTCGRGEAASLAPAVTVRPPVPVKWDLGRCYMNFLEYKRTHPVRDGAFYIVYMGRVNEQPFESREVAEDLLEAAEADGVAVDWEAALVLEAGNERGQRDAERGEACHFYSYRHTHPLVDGHLNDGDAAITAAADEADASVRHPPSLAAMPAAAIIAAAGEADATEFPQPAPATTTAPAKYDLGHCFQSFMDYKLAHADTVRDGAFYIVHKGRVMEQPLESRAIAQQLLVAVEAAGGVVDWGAALVMEAGNEWGQRDAERGDASHRSSYPRRRRVGAHC